MTINSGVYLGLLVGIKTSTVTRFRSFFARLTEGDDARVTESGEERITEEG